MINLENIEDITKKLISIRNKIIIKTSLSKEDVDFLIKFCPNCLYCIYDKDNVVKELNNKIVGNEIILDIIKYNSLLEQDETCVDFNKINLEILRDRLSSLIGQYIHDSKNKEMIK